MKEQSLPINTENFENACNEVMRIMKIKTLSELSKRAGLSENALRMIKKRERISIKSLEKLDHIGVFKDYITENGKKGIPGQITITEMEKPKKEETMKAILKSRKGVDIELEGKTEDILKAVDLFCRRMKEEA